MKHDGCFECKYTNYDSTQYPCAVCKQNFTDKFQHISESQKLTIDKTIEHFEGLKAQASWWPTDVDAISNAIASLEMQKKLLKLVEDLSTKPYRHTQFYSDTPGRIMSLATFLIEPYRTEQIETAAKMNAEKGDLILLPESIIDKLKNQILEKSKSINRRSGNLSVREIFEILDTFCWRNDNV